MSANEVIEQIKQLSGPEKLAVYSYVTAEMGFGTSCVSETEAGYSVRLDLRFQQAQDRVFRDHRDLLQKLAK